MDLIKNINDLTRQAEAALDAETAEALASAAAAEEDDSKGKTIADYMKDIAQRDIDST